MNRRNNCEQLNELLPAYALGIIDHDEQAEVERLLAECPDYIDELATYQALHDALLQEVPQIQPPAHLKAQIMQQVAGVGITPSQPVMPNSNISTASRGRLLLVAAAAIILVFVGVIAALLNQSSHNKLSAAEIAMQTLLKRQDVAKFDLVDVREEQHDATLQGVVLCHPDEQLVLIQVENFPPLQANEVYQIWLWQGDARIDGGTFRVDDAGNGIILFNAPEDMINYDYVGIIRTEAPGSLSPEGVPTARAQLYADVR
ncbi:MAG: anti-sigma factor [Phototrophicales bacterium]